MSTASRRQFLQTAALSSAVLGFGDLAFLSRLRPVSAAEATLNPNLVRLDADIEPTVRLLEDTPREQLLEEVASRIHKGLSYREVLAALLLAGVRNVQPRPNVGFKFHAVLVVNSAHLASLASPDNQRWLPIFWALDYFKDSQAATKRESGWRMKPVKEPALPMPREARKLFVQAMDSWDEEKADVAIAALARSASSNELFELFCKYGARDFRSIGHKAIYVANAWRTLDCIGWQHSEPVLRSLTYALLFHDGQNPSQNDLPADRPGKRNRELIGNCPCDWTDGKPSSTATTDLLGTLRQASNAEACEKVVALLNDGAAPSSIWDGFFAGATELLIRQPGIVALHAVTTTNALHYAYKTSANDETRRWLLLQNAAFLPLFRQAMAGRGAVKDLQIDKVEALRVDAAKPQAAIEEIFADVGKDRMTAARKALGYLDETKNARELVDTARVLVFLKGTDSHDYKFSSAVMEDYSHISPTWRNRFLAASLFQLRGSSAEDNPLVERTRAALKV